MRFQTVALGEGPVAHGALVGFVSAVGPHVDLQVFPPGALLPADAAHKHLDAQVDLEVAVQVGLLLEAAAALRALERRVVGVDPHVLLQVAPEPEALAADGAVERPHVAVSLEVSHQRRLPEEGPAADVAEELPVPLRVGLAVHLQRALQFEALAADPAGVLLVFVVGEPVLEHCSAEAERPAADVADVVLREVVQLLVRYEMRLQTERFEADVALVGFFVHVVPLVVAQRGHVGEGFAANVTFELTLPFVLRHVKVETLDGDERLAAVLAAVDVLVVSEMLLQLVRGLELLSTSAADALRVPDVTPDVADQTPQLSVPGATNFTGQLTLPGPLQLLFLLPFPLLLGGREFGIRVPVVISGIGA